ncbi:MAG: hypothetical protein IPL53_12050 [Ignavibacteria bacterium]|nr:hypothetical protein [Ignavibacteria bacterium]
MKKILMLLCFITSISNANSQDEKIYLTAGYNFNFPNASSVNFIIDRYNETRSYLTTKMDNINSMSGFDFSVGGIFSTGLLLEGGVTF